jgi:hypothetical protein
MPTFQKVTQDRSEYQPSVGRFLTAIPDNAIVLEGMDALYLNSERAAVLKEQQARAIESWVRSGGHLIVAVEQVGDVNNIAWLRRLVPVDLTGAKTIQPGIALDEWLRAPLSKSIAQEASLRGRGTSRQSRTNATADSPFANLPTDNNFASAQLPIATGTLRPESHALVTIDNSPVIVSSLNGNGRVTVLLFSPEREPVKSWRNQPTFWSRVADVPGRLYAGSENYYNSGLGTDGIFGAMIDSRQVRKLPIPWLLLMLIIYLAVIGPIDQLWLRKIGKPMLTWITFPCYVALFSGLIYLVGYKLRAGETEWNELHIVDVFQIGQKCEQRGHSYGSIYSPVNQRYTFESTAKTAAFRSEFAGNWNTDRNNDRGQITQSENSFKAEVFVPVWTCQLYVNDWLQAGEAPFFATIQQSGDGWTVNVQNKLGKPLSNIRLTIKGQIYDLGEVPANQSRQFTKATATSASPLGDFVSRTANMFENIVQSRRSAFGGSESGRINNLPDASEALSFLAYRRNVNEYYNFVAPPALDLSAAAEQDNAILVAWTANHSPTRPLNQFNARHSFAHTLWRMTLPLNSTH